MNEMKTPDFIIIAVHGAQRDEVSRPMHIILKQTHMF